MRDVLVTVIIRVAKFLTKATEGRKGSSGSQFWGTQSIVVEPSPCRSIKQLVPLYPVGKQREHAGAQLLFSFNSIQDSNPRDGTVYIRCGSSSMKIPSETCPERSPQRH